MTISSQVATFIEAVNGGYGLEVCRQGGKASLSRINIPRVSSGMLSLDLALGGGFPFEKMAIIAGEYSTGKSLIAQQTMSNVEMHDHKTKLHIDNFKGREHEFVPGTALYVDFEFTWDDVWAKTNGVNVENHVIAQPDYAEQGIDLISSALDTNAFDLIIVDSVAQMTPMTEIEESTENWQMGLAARLVNKAVRKWLSGLVQIRQRGEIGPVVLLLNQFRVKIGVQYGDPRTLPGGKGQEFCSSIIIYTHSQKYHDKKPSCEVEQDHVMLKGEVHKNKTYIPRQNYNFQLKLDGPGKGTIKNNKILIDEGKKHKIILKTKTGYVYAPNKLKTWANEKAIDAELNVSPAMKRMLWKEIIKAACGVTQM